MRVYLERVPRNQEVVQMFLKSGGVAIHKATGADYAEFLACIEGVIDHLSAKSPLGKKASQQKKHALEVLGKCFTKCPINLLLRLADSHSDSDASRPQTKQGEGASRPSSKDGTSM